MWDGLRSYNPWETAVGKKLYVGNLPYTATESVLEKLFAEHGSVSSVNVIMDRATGQSKGFAFVEMANENEANAAITALNMKEVDGRVINVSEARPQTDRGGRGRGGHGGRGGGGRRGW
jgi:RNA recognition motif-containing protein